MIASIILALALSVSAGEYDSILLQRVDMLKKEVGDYTKLEAKVDNTREAIEKEIRAGSLVYSKRMARAGLILEMTMDGTISIRIMMKAVPRFSARICSRLKLMGTVVR
jgi:hypothetical protein